VRNLTRKQAIRLKPDIGTNGTRKRQRPKSPFSGVWKANGIVHKRFPSKPRQATRRSAIYPKS